MEWCCHGTVWFDGVVSRVPFPSMKGQGLREPSVGKPGQLRGRTPSAWRLLASPLPRRFAAPAPCLPAGVIPAPLSKAGRGFRREALRAPVPLADGVRSRMPCTAPIGSRSTIEILFGLPSALPEAPHSLGRRSMMTNAPGETVSPLRQRMLDQMRLVSLAENTQVCYLREIT